MLLLLKNLLLNNKLVQYALLIIAVIVTLWLYTNHLENKLEDRILLEIENKTLQQREEFRQDEQEITNDVQGLDTEQLRDRTRQWMRPAD
jgi:hypothetical protein